MKTFILGLLVIVVSVLAMISFQSCYNGPDEVHQEKTDSHYIFTASNDYLYVISNDDLYTYKLDKGIIESTSESVTTYNGGAVFSQGNTLILGYNRGDIYDISQPGQLNYISGYSDLFLCDNLVLKDHYVFASVRIRSDCHTVGSDALQVIDISSTSPLVNSIPIDTPYGVSIDGDVLFLCQGDNGLSLFDIHDPLNITLIKHYDDIRGEYSNTGYGLLLITGHYFIEQYDYTDLNNLKLLSKIPIQR